jgi:hypothetical protein
MDAMTFSSVTKVCPGIDFPGGLAGVSPHRCRNARGRTFAAMSFVQNCRPLRLDRDRVELLIIRRGLASDYVLFLETTGRLNDIEVIVDRRVEERRGPQVETPSERRVAQRRGPEPETWRRSGFISIPPRKTGLPWLTFY